MKPSRAIYGASILALAASALGATDDTATDSADRTELEPITVTSPTPPLDRSLKLLRIMVEQSTPCLGCDAVLREPRPAPAVTLLRYLLVRPSPNEVDAATQLASEVRLHDAPDLEYLKR